MEDFWNEITTAENEENTKKLPEIEGVDIKEKQHEIEAAIKESKTPVISKVMVLYFKGCFFSFKDFFSEEGNSSRFRSFLLFWTKTKFSSG